LNGVVSNVGPNIQNHHSLSHATSNAITDGLLEGFTVENLPSEMIFQPHFQSRPRLERDANRRPARPSLNPQV
jgi:hypothetical protein